MSKGINELAIEAFASENEKDKRTKRRYNIDLDRPDTWPGVINPIDVGKFRTFIINLLISRCKVTKSEAENFTDESAMKVFIRSISHDTVNPRDKTDNYELLEHFGDTTVNKCISWYLRNRFPDVLKKGDSGVFIFSKQEALIKSKPYLARYSNKIGLDNFIQYRPLEYTTEQQSKKGERATEVMQIKINRSMKEDTFEAFFAALESVIDNKAGSIAVGYFVCFRLLSSILDEEDIPTTKNTLVDYVTQLKEVLDKRKSRQDGDVMELGDIMTKKYDYNIYDKKITLSIQLNKLARERGWSTVPELTWTENADSSSSNIVKQLLAARALADLQAKFGNMYQRFRPDE